MNEQERSWALPFPRASSFFPWFFGVLADSGCVVGGVVVASVCEGQE
jgi:hypothetical protein